MPARKVITLSIDVKDEYIFELKRAADRGEAYSMISELILKRKPSIDVFEKNAQGKTTFYHEKVNNLG